MLMGRYDYAIDAKGRLNFPARFRQEMGEVFVVTRWLDDCLVAFPQKEFERMAEVLAESHGRILLPANLRRHAHLEKDVTIIGSRNHAEIWDTALWDEHEAAMDQESIQAAMEALDL